MNNASSQAEQIADVFEDWLKAEVVTSGEGINSFLDAPTDEKLADIRSRMGKPTAEAGNWVLAKYESHTGRIESNFWPAFEATPLDHPQLDRSIAQLKFEPLMQISGTYRRQCYLEAASGADYMLRRENGVGIDLEKVIFEQLQKYAPAGRLDEATISMQGLKRSLDNAILGDSINIRSIIAHAAKGVNFMGIEDSLPARGAKKAQINWAQAATDCVIMASKLRKGELGAVPFWEPISITEQSGAIYYPLRERINWVEVLAT